MQRLRQLTFASLQCDRKKRKTSREIFPERMDGPIPWERLEARIAPACPKGGGKGGDSRIRCRRCCACTAFSRSATCATR